MRTDFLTFSPPLIGEEEIREVVDTLHSNWITTGPKSRQFEVEFASFLGCSACVSVNSCTAALHTALVASGIGPGDEVITTPITFVASVNVIEHVGAKPVLVDVEPDTLNIDPRQIERAIAPQTRAVLPVHFAGHPVDLDPIEELAQNHGVSIIEDAAHAFPSKYHGRFIGSGKNPAAFSFYATKNLTTAEGGMLTGTPDLIDRARVISLHGMSKDAWKRYDKGGSWYYEVLYPGFKYNMTDIQASLGLHQIRKIERFQSRRRQIVQMYNSAFGEEETLELPVERREVEHAWHLYVLRLRTETLRISRDQFIEELQLRKIGSSVHFIPVHLHPYYRDKYGWKTQDFPVAYANYQRMLSLPLNPRLTDQDVADVIEAVLDIVEMYRL